MYDTNTFIFCFWKESLVDWRLLL